MSADDLAVSLAANSLQAHAGRLVSLIDEARAAGWTWAQIAESAGFASRQAVFDWHRNNSHT